MPPPFVSFIGSGNVAWHLAPALDNAGFVVKEVYSRNPQNAAMLTERLYQAEVKASLDFSTSPSSVFILAVSDDAIRTIAQEIIIPEDAILVHTSGSQPIAELQFAATPNLAVLYPLQTFTKNQKIDFKNVPLFIETHTHEAEKTLMQLAKSISNEVKKIASTERKALHVAAIFASNFTNHMLTISREIMRGNSLDYDWLKPLITETIQKSFYLGPEDAQTGPAKRGDLDILDTHLEFLKDQAAIAEIYKVISQHIIDTHYQG
jgi:predicted short-subunit dehydrogenase-like oxidoreductase (DUF2520 family)